jgi:predicted nucleic acid-binding protein
MVKYIFLDTNNWIYLCNGYNVYSGKHEELHFKIFDTLKKRSEEGSLRFLINDIVIDEWTRNESQRREQLNALLTCE